jgi:hypothetical protein
VIHSKEFVTDDGVHINQPEWLWSLVDPWLQTFRGLSKPGLKQSVRRVRTAVELAGLFVCICPEKRVPVVDRIPIAPVTASDVARSSSSE